MYEFEQNGELLYSEIKDGDLYVYDAYGKELDTDDFDVYEETKDFQDNKNNDDYEVYYD